MRAKLVLLVLLVAVALVPSASASLITFSESTVFICQGAPFAGNPGCGTSFLTFGTISFFVAGGAPQTVNTPANTPFGDFLIRCVDTTTTCGPATFPSNALAMRLTINETSPIVASGNFTDAQIAAVGGGNVTISGNSSNAQAQWVSGSLTLGTTTYSILNNPLNLNSPNVNGGDTTIPGRVTDSTVVVPEPATLALLGAGLIGLTFVRRKA